MRRRSLAKDPRRNKCFNRMRVALLCHGRAWPGHPRLSLSRATKSWVTGPDPRVKRPGTVMTRDAATRARRFGYSASGPESALNASAIRRTAPAASTTITSNPYAVRPPLRMFRQNNLRRGDQARALARGESGGGIGQGGAGFYLDDRQQAVLLRDDVDFARGGADALGVSRSSRRGPGRRGRLPRCRRRVRGHGGRVAGAAASSGAASRSGRSWCGRRRCSPGAGRPGSAGA